MYVLNLPPFAELCVAETKEKMALLIRSGSVHQTSSGWSPSLRG